MSYAWTISAFPESFTAGHRWTLSHWRDDITRQETYERQCEDCGISQGVWYTLVELYQYTITPQRLADDFEKILTPDCTGKTVVSSDESPLRPLMNKLPALMTRVRYPCDCKVTGKCFLYDMVIHLNDAHAWTREAIADWLETLDVDLSFPTDGVG